MPAHHTVFVLLVLCISQAFAPPPPGSQVYRLDPHPVAPSNRHTSSPPQTPASHIAAGSIIRLVAKDVRLTLSPIPAPVGEDGFSHYYTATTKKRIGVMAKILPVNAGPKIEAEMAVLGTLKRLKYHKVDGQEVILVWADAPGNPIDYEVKRQTTKAACLAELNGLTNLTIFDMKAYATRGVSIDVTKITLSNLRIRKTTAGDQITDLRSFAGATLGSAWTEGKSQELRTHFSSTFSSICNELPEAPPHLSGAHGSFPPLSPPSSEPSSKRMKNSPSATPPRPGAPPAMNPSLSPTGAGWNLVPDLNFGGAAGLQDHYQFVGGVTCPTCHTYFPPAPLPLPMLTAPYNAFGAQPSHAAGLAGALPNAGYPLPTGSLQYTPDASGLHPALFGHGLHGGQ